MHKLCEISVNRVRILHDFRKGKVRRYRHVWTRGGRRSLRTANTRLRKPCRIPNKLEWAVELPVAKIKAVIWPPAKRFGPYAQRRSERQHARRTARSDIKGRRQLVARAMRQTQRKTGSPTRIGGSDDKYIESSYNNTALEIQQPPEHQASQTPGRRSPSPVYKRAAGGSARFRGAQSAFG